MLIEGRTGFGWEKGRGEGERRGKKGNQDKLPLLSAIHVLFRPLGRSQGKQRGMKEPD